MLTGHAFWAMDLPNSEKSHAPNPGVNNVARLDQTVHCKWPADYEYGSLSIASSLYASINGDIYLFGNKDDPAWLEFSNIETYMYLIVAENDFREYN